MSENLSICNGPLEVTTTSDNGVVTVISVIGTSDLHGAIFPLDYNTGLEENVGLAKVYTYVKSVRAANSNTMLIDNGDTIQGTPLSYFYDMIFKPFKPCKTNA